MLFHSSTYLSDSGTGEAHHEDIVREAEVVTVRQSGQPLDEDVGLARSGARGDKEPFVRRRCRDRVLLRCEPDAVDCGVAQARDRCFVGQSKARLCRRTLIPRCFQERTPPGL